jgi:hypothetical protein
LALLAGPQPILSYLNRAVQRSLRDIPSFFIMAFKARLDIPRRIAHYPTGSTMVHACWRNWSIVSELGSTSIRSSISNGLRLIWRNGVWYWAIS